MQEQHTISENDHISRVTVLYTANLAGDLALLPRLMTYINQQKQGAAGPVFLLDLGDTCSTEAWVCRATQGRAPFLVLDAMGYDAAVIGGSEQVPIPIPSLRKLTGTISLSLIVWNRAIQLTKRGITVTVAAGSAALPDTSPAIRIDRSVRALPDAGESLPVLGDVAQADIARVDLAWPDWTVESSQVITVSPSVPSDLTLAAVVDLVESEAKQYMQQP